MRSTGVVRKVDDLGRVVIPKELRRTMGIEEKDGLEIFVDSDRIILKKYAPGCVFCGGDIREYDCSLLDGAREHKGKYICPNCLKEIRS